MLVIPTTRQINGDQILVRDPQTGKPVEFGIPIDLDTVDFDKQMHYLRALEQGDFEVYTLPTTTSSKGVE
jgi:hypothetical protein